MNSLYPMIGHLGVIAVCKVCEKKRFMCVPISVDCGEIEIVGNQLTVQIKTKINKPKLGKCPVCKDAVMIEDKSINSFSFRQKVQE